MPALFLVVADAALRDAIAEQPALAALGALRVQSSLAAAADIFSGETAALVLDRAAADKKLRRRFGEADISRRPPVFLIGTADEDDEWIDESFPLPLRLGHLVARLQFHVQAARRAPAAPRAIGPWRLDTRLRQIVREGAAAVRLTEKETRLLDYLGQSAAPVGREELLASIWGYDARIDTHTLETHIYRLRQKLDPEGAGGELILFEDGAYRLAP